MVQRFFNSFCCSSFASCLLHSKKETKQAHKPCTSRAQAVHKPCEPWGGCCSSLAHWLASTSKKNTLFPNEKKGMCSKKTVFQHRSLAQKDLKEEA